MGVLGLAGTGTRASIRGESPVETIRGEYLVLSMHPPGIASFPAGILLLHTAENRLYTKFRRRWPSEVEAEDRRVFDAIAEDFSERAAEEPADSVLAEFEASFSHLLRLSARVSIVFQRPEPMLDRLFEKHVLAFDTAIESGMAGIQPKAQQVAEVIPFRTHLPFYPMHIAAGVFDGDAEVEASAWVPVPTGLRPEDGYFVGRISGRSMEPRIADGSFGLFRFHPQGSREGKLVLVQKYGTSDSGGAFTIKRYHSEKAPQTRPGDDFGDSGEWRHARVRLISLNPNYPSWDLAEGECRIIAELVRILREDEVPEDLTT